MVRLELTGTIDPVIARYLSRGLRHAEETQAEAVFIRLDSAGGVRGAVEKAVQDILDSPVPVIVHVAPRGARAAGLSLLIPMAAHVGVMAPETEFGGFDPAGAGNAVVQPAGSGLFAGPLRSVAEVRGKDSAWVRRLLREGLRSGPNAALEAGAIDGVAEEPKRVLEIAESREVRTVLGRTRLRLTGRPASAFRLAWGERILHRLAEPVTVYGLLAAGMVGLNVGLVFPVGVLPGLLGGVVLLAALLLAWLLEVHWIGLIAILLAQLLFMADRRQAVRRLLSVAGLALFVWGSLRLLPPDSGTGVTLPLSAVAAGSALMVAFVLAAQIRPARRDRSA